MQKKLKIVATSKSSALELAEAIGSYGYDSEISDNIVITEAGAMTASAILRSLGLEDRVALAKPDNDYYPTESWIILD